MKITHAFILLYFVFLLATLWWGPRFIQGPWIFLLRAFFPNWKFFHAVGDEPRLYVRCGEPTGTPRGLDPGLAWHLIYPRRPRSMWGWVHNPDVNLVQALAREACVEQLGAQAGQVFEFEIRLERSDTAGVVASHTLMQAPAAAV